DAGSRIERARRLRDTSRWHNGDIADAAEVLERSPLGGMREQERVGGRYERRALPPCRHVTHAKVAHDIDAGALRDDGRLAELPGGVPGLVPDGLPVTRDRSDVGATDTGIGYCRDGCLGEPVAQVEREPAILARRCANEGASKTVALPGVVFANA